MRYFLHFDENTGQIIGVFCDAVHDVSIIPEPHIEISAEEHGDWMQHQATRKVDLSTKKLVEYTPPEPEPQIITPEVDQGKADLWEAILALTEKIEALEGGKA